MQYADSGNLRQYLKEHFSELNWDDKLKFAYQITEGIKYLHDYDVFHQNLHSKNVVIHKKEAKIMLDIMKCIETDSLDVSDEMIPYVDPKLLENHSYEYDKKSDIYSLGVLMWELTSGHPPFIDNETENLLEIHLISGHREKPIANTPIEYLDLYKSCWDPEPSERPSIDQVFNILGKLLYAQIKQIIEPSELLNLVEENNLTNIINKDDLSEEKSNIDGDTILKITWKKTKCTVVYKRLKTINLNEAFIHELKVHKTLNSCSRIVRILGVSLGKVTWL
jgi:serine/threonine protein kinase